MNHILPISYALLDNYNPYYQSIGAALLLHILHRSTPENLYMHWENLESITDNVWKGGCRDKMWNVAFLLLARTELMEMLKQYDTTTTNHTRVTNPRKTMVSTPPMMSIAAKRRKFSQELFIKLKKRLFSRSSKDYPVVDQNLNEDENNDNEAVNIGRDEEDMITPLLLAGICPLLAQHTAMGTRNDEQRRDADAMEISTDGLSALLFLMESLEWEISHVSPDVEKLWILPISTIIALISLLMSTHPIMKYHGGKIMCALLSILGNCDKNIQNYHNNNLPRSITIEHANLFISFTIHAASIALVICGKLAENVLDKVEETCVDSLVHRCIEIREVAKQLMLQTENN